MRLTGVDLASRRFQPGTEVIKISRSAAGLWKQQQQLPDSLDLEIGGAIGHVVQTATRLA